MVERENSEAGGGLRRWSRRKQALANGSKDPAAENEELAANAATTSAEPLPGNPAESATDAVDEEPLLTDEDMPAIETIGKDSDISCFFNRGVSETLRQRALKQLLRLPAFNITDGLNDYDEDYTSFEPLGDIVTSDMRFQAKRKEKLAAQQREEEQALAREQAEEHHAAESADDEPNPVADAGTSEPVDHTDDENATVEAAHSVSPDPHDGAPTSAASLPLAEPDMAEPEHATPSDTKPGDLA